VLEQRRERPIAARLDGVAPVRPAPRLRRPTSPPAGEPSRAEPVAARDDALTGLVARAVRRRASRPLLQRAIIAIDGPTDNALQLQATRNCLDNLRVKGTRGAAVGPALLGAIAPPALGAGETLYVLAHGAPPGTTPNVDLAADTVGGLDPDQMGAQIVAWYPGVAYTGKIKLVACVSAASAAAVRGGLTYADSLSRWFATNATGTFKPASVDGIIGVGWVDETTSKQQSIDTPRYLDPSVDKNVFGDVTSATRQAGITRELGAIGGPYRVTGKASAGGGKVRYDVGYPPPPAPLPAAPAAPVAVPVPAAATTAPTKKVGFFRGVWNALTACIP